MASLAPVAGMALWLKADAGVLDGSGNPATDGVAVATWQDQSGNGYGATQATGGSRPLCKMAVLNGLPILRFDGVGNWLRTPLFASPLTASTIFLVAKCTQSSIEQVLIDGAASHANQIEIFPAGFWSMYAGNPESVIGPATTNWTIFDVAFDGSSSSAFLNGGSIASIATGTQTLTQLFIGATHDPAFFCSMDVAAILVYPAALSDADRMQNETYLNAKYAIY